MKKITCQFPLCGNKGIRIISAKETVKKMREQFNITSKRPQVFDFCRDMLVEGKKDYAHIDYLRKNGEEGIVNTKRFMTNLLDWDITSNIGK